MGEISFNQVVSGRCVLDVHKEMVIGMIDGFVIRKIPKNSILLHVS